MEGSDPEEAEGVPVRDPRPAVVLTVAGALVLAASLVPWPMIDILHPFSPEPNGLWLHVDLPILPAGVGIIVIGSRIALEAGEGRRPWASAGLSLILLVVGLAVAFGSLSLLGPLSFGGWASLFPVLAFFAALAFIGSRIPMRATARRPRSVAMVLALAAFFALLLVRAPSLQPDPQGWGSIYDSLTFGWLVGVIGAVIATAVAWRLRSQVSLRPAT